MKQNYRAWLIKIDDFYKNNLKQEQFKLLLNFAVLAPSSHNSQPWRFKASENTIEVHVESTRRLKESDKNDRQLFISLGCAIKNILIAGNYYGLHGEVKYFPNQENHDHAATIHFKKSIPDTSKNHLIFSIPKRVTNRNKCMNKSAPELLLQKVKSLSTDNLRIDMMSDQQKKNQLADVAIEAGITAMEDDNFRKELSHYVKSNITSSPIGMPAFGMGIPAPISFIAPAMLKRINMNKKTRKKDKKLLKEHTPLFIVISTKEDNPITWMKTGQVYEEITLRATRDNLTTQPWAAPIQIREYYKEFQKILNIEFRPQFFCRMGYPIKPTPHSPRLGADEVSI